MTNSRGVNNKQSRHPSRHHLFGETVGRKIKHNSAGSPSRGAVRFRILSSVGGFGRLVA